MKPGPNILFMSSYHTHFQVLSLVKAGTNLLYIVSNSTK